MPDPALTFKPVRPSDSSYSIWASASLLSAALLLAVGASAFAQTREEITIYRDGFGTPHIFVRWIIDGVTVQTIKGAVSTTTNFGACIAAAANTTQQAIIQSDYLLVKANRDWTV